MQTLKVELADRSYPIHIGSGLLSEPELIRPHLASASVAIVTNPIIGEHYLKQLLTTLQAADAAPIVITLPDGEANKNTETLQLIYTGLLKNHCDRKTTLIALGGGVIGDMCGFAAATYQRGVPFIQIPTTLLAQVDSSVGGKTGINHPMGKNMIGAFYQPELVLTDINTLNTLPDRELSAGLAEVIKYGLLGDEKFFKWLEDNIESLLTRDAASLSYAIKHSCEMKAKIVADDEREKGQRALLNLGHTFGHAIEAAMGYGVWLHGEAVAAGMALAARLSCAMGLLDKVSVSRIVALLVRARLPVKPPQIEVTEFIEIMKLDKKSFNSNMQFILLKQIGRAYISGEVQIDTLRKLLSSA
ncbi:MAG: 3-dehydroquinate synthase [Burkholderiales bacterium]